MITYKILPSDLSRAKEVRAPDAAAIFQIIGRLECREADVLADDEYAFSVRLADNGLWMIFQRGGDIRRDDVTAHG